MTDTDTTEEHPQRTRATEHTLEDAENDYEAARLRSIGFTYREIAGRQQCSLATAHRRVKRALAAVPSESVKDLREMEGRRLDDMWKIAWREASAERPLVSNGRIVRNTDGTTVIDYGAKLHAITALVRIQERRARLHGLDAPAKIDVDLAVTTETLLDQDIRQLIEQMTAGGVLPADAPA